MTSDPASLRYRWVMLAAVCMAYFAFGVAMASLAPLVNPIVHDLKLSLAFMGLVFGSWQFAYLFVSIPVGAAIDRFGLRYTVLLGVLLMGFAQLLRSTAVNGPTLLGSVLVLGLGAPVVSIGAPKLVAQWFTRQEMGMALGIYGAMPGLGSILALASANSLLMPHLGNSWRLTQVAFAIPALLAAAVWVLIAREYPGQEPARARRATAFRAFAQLARIPLMQIVLVMAVGAFMFSHSFISWLPAMLQHKGMSATEAGVWSSVPALVGVGVGLTVVRFVRDDVIVYIQVSVFLMGSAAALLVAFGNGPSLDTGLCLLGVVRGSATTLLTLSLLYAPQIGPRLVGAAAGLYFTAGQIGGVLGPSLTGSLAGNGSFTDALLMLAAVSAILAVMSVVLRLVQPQLRAKRVVLETVTGSLTLGPPIE